MDTKKATQLWDSAIEEALEAAKGGHNNKSLALTSLATEIRVAMRPDRDSQYLAVGPVVPNAAPEAE